MQFIYKLTGIESYHVFFIVTVHEAPWLELVGVIDDGRAKRRYGTIDRYLLWVPTMHPVSQCTYLRVTYVNGNSTNLASSCLAIRSKIAEQPVIARIYFLIGRWTKLCPYWISSWRTQFKIWISFCSIIRYPKWTYKIFNHGSMFYGVAHLELEYTCLFLTAVTTSLFEFRCWTIYVCRITIITSDDYFVSRLSLMYLPRRWIKILCAC